MVEDVIFTFSIYSHICGQIRAPNVLDRLDRMNRYLNTRPTPTYHLEGTGAWSAEFNSLTTTTSETFLSLFSWSKRDFPRLLI